MTTVAMKTLWTLLGVAVVGGVAGAGVAEGVRAIKRRQAAKPGSGDVDTTVDHTHEHTRTHAEAPAAA